MTHPGSEPRAASPAPSPLSGVLDLPASTTWAELVEAALRWGWSADGLQPELPEATLGELVARRQPRPVIWACGLLPERCIRYVVRRPGAAAYTSIRAPRKASGPDWAYLFVGNAADGGKLVEVSVSLLRPAARYFLAEATYDDPHALFEAAQKLALLEPFSTRRLDWRERRLFAAVPARRALVDALRDALQGLGCTLETATGVPDSLRFLAPLGHHGPSLVVSGAYDLVAAAVEALEGDGGAEPFVAVRYADGHGVEAFVGVPNGEAARLEPVWARCLDAGPELHDARRRDSAADAWQWLASPFDLGAPP